MITPEELASLLTDEVRRAVADNRGRDPLAVALDRKVPCARLVATQVKYLARALRKLPAYAAAGCILPPRAFEQASSEACARHKRIGGDSEDAERIGAPCWTSPAASASTLGPSRPASAAS